MTLYKEGSRGEVVKQIQKALNIYPDGIFGRLTKEAVVEFQKANGLTPDGIVGVKTIALLLPTKLLPSTRVITEIIVHCTATREGQEMTVEQIRAGHVAPVSKGGRGWSDIGYHYVVTLDGSIHKGRNVNISGAHCLNHNTHSIGVVYVGGLENIPNIAYKDLPPKDTRTPRQKEALLSLLKDLKKLYPSARIYGHRDFANKACPSFDARKEYMNI